MINSIDYGHTAVLVSESSGLTVSSVGGHDHRKLFLWGMYVGGRKFVVL